METVATILAIIKTIAAVAPVAIQGVEDAKKFIVPLWRDLTGGEEMTSEEEDAIDAGIAAMSAELQALRRPA